MIGTQPDGTDCDWTVRVDGWDAARITHHGNLFLLGNGHMGYRGTLEEFGPDEKVGILLPGLYDKVGDAWREPVNAPNGLFTRTCINGRWLSPLDMEPLQHRQELDLRNALHRRATTFVVDGVTVSVEAERFLSAAEVNLMAMRYVVTVDAAVDVVIETGVDQRVWDLNGPHLEALKVREQDGCLVLGARTHELRHAVAVAEHARIVADVPVHDVALSGSLRQFKLATSGPASIELVKVVAVCWSLDTEADAVGEAALAHTRAAAGAGYAVLRETHCGVWAERWARADVVIDGDPDGQHALRYSLYQLLCAAPFHSEHLSIPARALSGQVYKGAVFWDTEVFMFPFFLGAFPEVARNLVMYRVHTLPGARAKAREYCCHGAYYPWEGQEGGHDACTLFNITDVFTGRPMRTYFRDKQVHISGDVAWAVWQYFLATGDAELLWQGGFEVMLECARFFLSYAYRTPDGRRFVLVDVTGPDEYHERVANNAYTNHLAQYAAQAVLAAAEHLEAADRAAFAGLCDRLDFSRGEAARLKDFADWLYLPQPDPLTGVIEQFDGYLQLEDCSLEALKARILDPNEYLGGGSGLATTTRILKQADVVLLTHLLGDRFSSEVKRANWDFYEPRTEHGSSLSACAYALVACATGRLDFAYTYFLKTATIDLSGKSKQYVGTLYIGGTHPAANGGAWMVAVQGFGGLRLLPSYVEIQPVLPPQWRSLRFTFHWRGRRATVTIQRDQVTLRADPSSDGPIPCRGRTAVVSCDPGDSVLLD